MFMVTNIDDMPVLTVFVEATRPSKGGRLAGRQGTTETAQADAGRRRKGDSCAPPTGRAR